MLSDKNLFLESGYLNMREIIEHPAFTKVIIGGRGTGKTYGVLDYVFTYNMHCFMLRRTAEVVKTLMIAEMSPFKKLARKKEIEIEETKLGNRIMSYRKAEEGRDYNCLLSALTTFNNLRGFDADTINMLFYDEFIRIKSERKIKGEADGFFNAIETINRNREIEGESPINVILSGNSDLLDSEILVELGIVNKIIKMRKTGQAISYLKQRGLLLIVLKDSPISEKKKDTALYKLTAGSKFNQMAIENKFVSNELSAEKHYSLKEVIPLFVVDDDICVYKVKGNKGRYWCSAHRSGNPEYYNFGDIACKRIAKKYRNIWSAYFDNLVDFESNYLELIFRNIFTNAR